MRIPFKRVEFEGFVIKGHSKVISTFDEFKRCSQSCDEIAFDLMELREQKKKEE
jgi:hypothetical protein